MPFVPIGIEPVLQQPHSHDPAAKIDRAALRRIDNVDGDADE